MPTVYCAQCSLELSIQHETIDHSSFDQMYTGITDIHLQVKDIAGAPGQTFQLQGRLINHLQENVQIASTHPRYDLAMVSKLLSWQHKELTTSQKIALAVLNGDEEAISPLLDSLKEEGKIPY